MEVLAPPFGIKPIFGGYRLQKRGFSGTVLADEECDRWMELQPLQMPHRRDAKRVPVEARDGLPLQSDSLQKGLFDDGRHCGAWRHCGDHPSDVEFRLSFLEL